MANFKEFRTHPIEISRPLKTTATGEAFVYQPEQMKYLKNLQELIRMGWSLTVQVQEPKGDSIISDRQLKEIENLPVISEHPQNNDFEVTQAELDLRLLDIMHFRAKSGYEIDVACILPPSWTDGRKFASWLMVRSIRNSHHYMKMWANAKKLNKDDWFQEEEAAEEAKICRGKKSKLQKSAFFKIMKFFNEVLL